MFALLVLLLLNLLFALESPAKSDSPFLNFEDDAEIDRLNLEMEKAYQQGSLEQALTLSREVAALAGRNFGGEHSEYARALNNLAFYEQSLGDNAAARRHFEQALSIYEAARGKDSPKMIPVLNNLAILLAAQGDAHRAAPLLERSLALQESLVGENSADLSSTLNNLAVVQDAAGLKDESLKTLLRAYKIQSASGAQSDPVEKALTLSNLSMVYKAQQDNEQALRLLSEALSLREKFLSADDLDLAETLNNLAVIELSQGKDDLARSHFQRALSISEKNAAERPELVSILNNMAALDLRQSHFETARQFCLRSAALVDRQIAGVFPGLSFAEQRAFLNTLLPTETALLISTSRSDLDARASYNYLFRWKGLLIDSLRRQSQLRLLESDPVNGADVKKLILLRARMTRLFNQSGKSGLEEWRRSSDQLLAEKEELERRLAGKLNAGTVNDLLFSMGLEQFARLLKDDEILVDVYYYRNSGRDAGNRYAGFVLDANARVSLLDLGDADSLNREIKTWLEQTVQRENNDAVFQSLKKRLSVFTRTGSGRVFLCVDSDLHRLPLSVFVDVPLLAHLDAPRELAYLRLLPAKQAKAPSFLGVGGVDFGKAGSAGRFLPLPATLLEVEKLSGLAAKENVPALILSGLQASKQRVLLELPGHEQIHLATHGVFSESGYQDKAYFLKGSNARLKAAIDLRDPLARSGIVLAGDGADGNEQSQILSAEEMVSADLGHCRSIVLSACDTGLGDKENGQGVLGLRASIMAAGARMLLISLWRVPDYATALFMEEFYKNIWQKKLPAAEAVRNARKAVAARDYFKNMADWGAWVLVGEGW